VSEFIAMLFILPEQCQQRFKDFIVLFAKDGFGGSLQSQRHLA